MIANGEVEIHRIEFRAGYRCSKHHHQSKSNWFYCITGKLIIRVWQTDYDLVDETVLGPGEHTVVKPGLDHEFEGLEGGVALEAYWAELQHHDIIRTDHGGPCSLSPNLPEEASPRSPRSGPQPSA